MAPWNVPLYSWDPRTDPALGTLLADEAARARKDLPNVLIDSGRTPSGFSRLHTLILGRARCLQLDALNEAAPDVEFVVAHATLLQAGLCHQSNATIPDLQPRAEARATARNLALAREIVQAKERVSTRSDTHAAAIHALLLAGNDAMAELDRIIKAEHRFGHYLTYSLPDPLRAPQDCLEIGLSRVLEVFASTHHRKYDDTERGAA